MKALVGRNGYLMRRLIGEVVRSADDKRLTESQLLEMLGLESIQSLIRKRKLQWVAHCARRGDKDLTWKRMVREIEDEKSKWGSRLKEDWKELGVNTVRGWCNKVKDRCWLASKGGGREDRKGVETQHAGMVALYSTRHVCGPLCNVTSPLSWADGGDATANKLVM